MTAARNEQVYFKSLSLTNVRSFGEKQKLDMTIQMAGRLSGPLSSVTMELERQHCFSASH